MLSLPFLQQAFAQTIPFLKSKNYEVIFEVVDKKLRIWLEEVSTLRKSEEDVPSVSLLKKRAEDDLPELLKALHSRGYYSAVINVNIVEGAEGKKDKAIYNIQPGALYHIESEEITLIPPTPADIKIPDLKAVKPSIGKPADAGVLLEGASIIRKYIAENNCLLSVDVKPAMRLNTAKNTASAFFEVATGSNANFGELIINGNENVKESAIRKLIPWKKGECFNASTVDKAKSKLLKSGLFSVTEITPGAMPDENGEVAVTITIKERFHRTVKTGLSYMTDEGLGISAGWEHRNLFKGGEKLEVLGVVSELKSSAEASFTKPAFLRSDQSLKLGARAAHEEPAAYTSDNISLTSLIERELNNYLRVGAGVGYRLSHVEDIITGEEDYGLIYLPLYGAYDSRDDVLNPKKGINARIDGAPYFDTLGSDARFIRTVANASTYFSLPGRLEPVLAVRGALGSINGASTSDIPADVRLYAGGGSSVRGYGYQELSPELNGEPIGGKSLMEISTEVRMKFTDTFGGAVFLDGGNAFENEYPDFKEGVRWGAGVGIRYYTGFGPLRLDVAMPLDKRTSDSSYQLYVSLGQAF